LEKPGIKVRLFLYLYKMKAEELIYNLRTNLGDSASILADTTDQHLMYMLDEARATLASQKMDVGINLNQMTQFVDVKPVKAPKAEVGTVGNANVVKLVLPQPITYKNGEGIFSVGSTDGDDSYTRITFSQLRTVLFRKYTSNTPKWFWLNGAIYVVNVEVDSLQKIRVWGIFNEPYKIEIAMGRYKYLDPFNWEYPLTLKDAKTVYQLAMSGDMGWGDTAVSAIQKEKKKQSKDQEILGALKGGNNNAEV
jgi:hypothetical protein